MLLIEHLENSKSILPLLEVGNYDRWDWVSPCYEKDASVFLTKTESHLQLGGSAKLYLIELIDEWERHWLLGCVCALSFLGLCSASYKGKTNLSGCISRIPLPHPFTSFGQWEASKGDGEHKEKTMRPFLFPSQGASPARSCLLCGFCAPRLGTPHCSSQYRTLPALASLSAAFLYKVYFLISSIYLTSSVHLIPFVSTNKIIRAENGEIWRNPAVQNKVSIQFLRILT